MKINSAIFRGVILKNSSSGPVVEPMVMSFAVPNLDNGIELPFRAPLRQYDITVDWGDGIIVDYVNPDPVTHSYASTGTYTVSVSGTADAYGYTETTEPFVVNPDVISVSSWGTLGLTSLAYAFYNNTALTSVAAIPPSVTSTSNMFTNVTTFNLDISSWNTANVTDMSAMFRYATAFNQPIGSWNTSSVTDMSFMFDSAESFNQSLNSWNVSNVTTMEQMFSSAVAFNGNITSWTPTSLTSMYYMFYNADSFNQDISGWNVSSVTDMNGTFSSADLFNQPIGSWNTSSVVDMAFMFSSANAFNQPIGSWVTSNVTSMDYMFEYTPVFNQDLTGWDVHLIASEPPDFAIDSALLPANYPIWGTTGV